MKRYLLRLASLLPLLLLPLSAAETPAPVPTTPAVAAPDDPAKANWDWFSALLPKVFQANPSLEMTVITEVTPAGKKLPPVSTDHPAYYDAQSGGDHEMGELTAHEQKMTGDEVGPLLVHGLGVNGYLPAKLPEHPPGLLIIYIWGTHNALTATDGQDNPVNSAEEVRRNVLDRAALVGGKKFADEIDQVISDTQIQSDANSNAGLSHMPVKGTSPVMVTSFNTPVNEFKMRKANNETLLNQALGDVFYVVASAFDYASVAQGRPVLLWRTRMTVGSQGVAMKQAVPTVVASAGKFFGREMTEPEIINRRPVPVGKVEVGTPTVVEPGSEGKK